MFTSIPTRPRRHSTGFGENISEYGAHWGVTKELYPGDTLTLTVGGAYFAKSSSTFPSGSSVYAYLDSINYATTYGNVRESNETNNVFGPILSTAGAGDPAGVIRSEAEPSTELPRR